MKPEGAGGAFAPDCWSAARNRRSEPPVRPAAGTGRQAIHFDKMGEALERMLIGAAVTVLVVSLLALWYI